MTDRRPTPTTAPRSRLLLLGLLVAVLLAVPAVAGRVLGSSSPSSSTLLRPSTSAGASSSAAAPPRPGSVGTSGPLGQADGAVPDGTSVYDDDLAGVARLDPALRDALRRAAGDAADAGLELEVNSGWRSAAYQDHLLREAVAEHGSEEAAARWVAAPEASAHVSGDAVDIGPPEAAEWLAGHGDEHGLCRVYENEPWHFELRPDAPEDGCPALYADPTEDPRMQR